MRLEVHYWILFFGGALAFLGGVIGILWMTLGITFDNLRKFEKLWFALLIVAGLSVGFTFLREDITYIDSVVKGEYVEVDVEVVSCDLNPKGLGKYKKIVIYNPETNEYFEVEHGGTPGLTLEVGKTYRVRYYPKNLESQHVYTRNVDFLYCVDDLEK